MYMDLILLSIIEISLSGEQMYNNEMDKQYIKNNQTPEYGNITTEIKNTEKRMESDNNLSSI